MKKWNLYTDGACQPNPGVGGIGAVLYDEDYLNIYLIFGSTKSEQTTNNRMELSAVIYPLKFFKELILPKDLTNHSISVYSDSQYLVNTMNLDYKKNKNTDIWPELEIFNNTLNLSWHWVRGHNGTPCQEVCDRLAVTSIKHKSHLSVYKINEQYFDILLNNGTSKEHKPELIKKFDAFKC